MSHTEGSNRPKVTQPSTHASTLGQTSVSRPHVRTAMQTSSHTQPLTPFPTCCITSVSSTSYTYPSSTLLLLQDCGYLPTYPLPYWNEPPMGSLLPPMGSLLPPVQSLLLPPTAHIEEVEEEPKLPPPPEPRRRTILDLCSPTPPPNPTPLKEHTTHQQNPDTENLSERLRSINSAITQLGNLMVSVPPNTLTPEHLDLIIKLNKLAVELIQHWRSHLE